MADPYAGLGTVVSGGQPDPYEGLGRVVSGRPRGRRMAADAQASRARGDKIVRLSKSLKIGSEGYRAAVAKLPQGAYYYDPQNNLRRKDNASGGNPIIRKAGSTKGALGEAGGFAANLNRLLLVGDELSAGLGTIGNVLTGQIKPDYEGTNPLGATPLLKGIGNDFTNQLAIQRGFEDDFTKRRPWTAAAARTVGMAPTLFVPGGAPAQAATRGEAVAGAAGNAALYAGTAGVLDRGTLQERNKQGAVNALIAAPLAGGLTGLATRAPRPKVNRNAGLDAAQKVAKQDPAAMRARADEYRAAGINPTLADVTDDSGRGVIRATASKMTPARQAVTDFRDGRAVDLPDRIGGQARRYISSDPRTPDAIRAEIAATRSAQASKEFGAVRDTPVSLDENTVMALRSPRGRAEIKNAAQAALNSLDPAEREVGAALNRLADDVLDAPGETRITVGMAQQISKTLQDAAERARGPMGSATNDTRLFTGLASAIRDNARRQVPGYDTALKGYEVNSGLLEATTIGQDFTRRNTDEFVSAVRGMSPEQRTLAQAGARRSIETAVGENPASAPGFARRYALGAEPKARTDALIGPTQGNAFRNALSLEENALRNANDIAPRGGSQTALRGADAEAVDGAMSMAGKVATGNWRGAVIDVGLNWWRSRGFNNQTAEEFTMLAIDPRQTDAAIRYIEQKYGPQVAQQFQQFTAVDAIRAARATGTGVAAANQNRPNALATATQ